MRIVSLLPSATEMVSALGMADLLVGVTHRCEWPPEVKHLPKVTRSVLTTERTPAEISATVRRYREASLPLYDVDQALLRELAPDLIITQKVFEVCAVTSTQARAVVSLTAAAARVVVLQARRLGDILRNLQMLSEELGVADRGDRLVKTVRTRLSRIAADTAGRPRPSVFAVEWLNPLKCTGGWLPDLIQAAGGDSLLTVPGEKVRPIAWEEVLAAGPEVLLIMPCGWPLARVVEHARSLAERPGWGDIPAVQSGRVCLVDGCLCSRHGPRIADAVEMLARFLHPDAMGGVPDTTLALSWEQAYGEAP